MTWAELQLALQVEAERSYGSPIRVEAYRKRAVEDQMAEAVKQGVGG